jgi:hypothetical protein
MIKRLCSELSDADRDCESLCESISFPIDETV